MSYYLAPSLAALRAEANARWPNRDKTSDGWIGDTSHAARKSDHNPDYSAGGVVRAYDLDEDLDGNQTDHGAELSFLAEHIRSGRDPRVKYVIYEGRMFASYSTATRRAWEWGPYDGVNAHRKHLHVSILSTRAAEQDTRSWFPGKAADGPAPKPPVPQEDDMSAEDVKAITKAVTDHIDRNLRPFLVKLPDDPAVFINHRDGTLTWVDSEDMMRAVPYDGVRHNGFQADGRTPIPFENRSRQHLRSLRIVGPVPAGWE